MSRLDDELRNAFRRQPPPEGFAARVLERIAQQPAPRPSWRRRLAMLFEPPKLRWVAIGVTASLLLAIGAAQYSRLNEVAIDDHGKVAKVEAPAESSSESGVKPGGDVAQRDTTPPTLTPTNPKRSVASSTKRQLALARLRKERELTAQARAAKEKLMLALYIASATLNDAQKAIHDDTPKP